MHAADAPSPRHFKFPPAACESAVPEDEASGAADQGVPGTASVQWQDLAGAAAPAATRWTGRASAMP